MTMKLFHSAFVFTVLSLSSVAAYSVPAHAADPAKPAAVAPAAATPATASPIKQGDPVVAKVNGTDIKRSEVLNLLAQQPEQVRSMDINEIFPKAQDQVIANHIVLEKAGKANLGDDPEVKTSLEQARQQIIAGVYVERQVKTAMTDKKLHEIYDKAASEDKNVEEVKARQIVSDTEDKAKDVIAQLNKGADFEKLAKAGGGASAANGGELGYFTKAQMPVPALADAAFALKKGEYSKTPVKTQLGWTVLQVEDRRKHQFPKFEDVKPQVETVARQQIITDLLKQWQKDADVKKFDMNGDPVKAK